MNDLNVSCVDYGSEFNFKNLWRETAHFQPRNQIQVSAGRQQQAGKEDYLSDFNRSSRDMESLVQYLCLISKLPRYLVIGNINHIVHSRLRRQLWAAHVALAERNTPTFLDRATRLEQGGYTDAALDLLYDHIYAMLKSESFNKVDSLLRSVSVYSLSIDLLLGLLTATLPARSKLPFRKTFFSNVETALRSRGEWEENLLAGLES